MDLDKLEAHAKHSDMGPYSAQFVELIALIRKQEAALRAQAAPVAASDLHAWEALRADVLHGVDGLDNDKVNIVLGMIDYYAPAHTQQPATVPAEQDAELDHGETVLRLQEALGCTNTGWISPDVLLLRIEQLKASIDPWRNAPDWAKPSQPPDGEFPVLPDAAVSTDTHIDGKGHAAYTADQMREYGRLCRAAGVDEAAEVCDAQSSEPECPERAQYCADAIRALNKTGAV